MFYTSYARANLNTRSVRCAFKKKCFIHLRSLACPFPRIALGRCSTSEIVIITKSILPASNFPFTWYSACFVLVQDSKSIGAKTHSVRGTFARKVLNHTVLPSNRSRYEDAGLFVETPTPRKEAPFRSRPLKLLRHESKPIVQRPIASTSIILVRD
jgi:hypothetical protein